MSFVFQLHSLGFSLDSEIRTTVKFRVIYSYRLCAEIWEKCCCSAIDNNWRLAAPMRFQANGWMPTYYSFAKRFISPIRAWKKMKCANMIDAVNEVIYLWQALASASPTQQLKREIAGFRICASKINLEILCIGLRCQAHGPWARFQTATAERLHYRSRPITYLWRVSSWSQRRTLAWNESKWMV